MVFLQHTISICSNAVFDDAYGGDIESMLENAVIGHKSSSGPSLGLSTLEYLKLPSKTVASVLFLRSEHLFLLQYTLRDLDSL